MIKTRAVSALHSFKNVPGVFHFQRTQASQLTLRDTFSQESRCRVTGDR